ncbi:hypothetical protein [Amycolatopsis plumensis]
MSADLFAVGGGVQPLPGGESVAVFLPAWLAAWCPPPRSRDCDYGR